MHILGEAPPTHLSTLRDLLLCTAFLAPPPQTHAHTHTTVQPPLIDPRAAPTCCMQGFTFWLALVSNVLSVCGLAGVLNAQRELVLLFFIGDATQFMMLLHFLIDMIADTRACLPVSLAAFLSVYGPAPFLCCMCQTMTFKQPSLSLPMPLTLCRRSLATCGVAHRPQTLPSLARPAAPARHPSPPKNTHTHIGISWRGEPPALSGFEKAAATFMLLLLLLTGAATVFGESTQGQRFAHVLCTRVCCLLACLLAAEFFPTTGSH